MAMEVLTINSGGSFLDAPGAFSGGGQRTNVVPPSGFDTTSVRRSPLKTTLNFNTTNHNDDDDDDEFETISSSTPFITTPHSLDATPDSGISGLACGSTRSKSPDILDVTGCLSMTPSSSTGSGSGINSGGGSARKRKTVTIDESQTSVVVISPDDLFNTYSKAYSPSSPSYGYSDTEVNHDHAVYHIDDDGDDDGDNNNDDGDKYYWESDPMLPLREEDPSVHYRVDTETGWPLKRSDSLESRDNPFLPGGDLCKEAEDLLSKATIIRDNFYLNEEEKRELEQHRQAEQREAELQQQQKSRGATKHVQILDHHDGRIYSSADPSSPPHNGVEERISPQSVSNSFAAPSTTVPSADPNHKGENGKSNDHTNNASSPESVKIAIPEGEGQSIGVPGQGDSLGPDKKRRNKCCVVM